MGGPHKNSVPFEKKKNMQKEQETPRKMDFEQHCENGRRLRRLEIEHSAAIEEFHLKKCIKTKKGFTPPEDRLSRLVYDKLLFVGRKRLSSMDVFPCAFQSALEDSMLHSNPDLGSNFSEAYYNLSRHVDLMDCPPVLSAGKTVTATDVITLIDMMERRLQWMTDAVSVCRSTHHKQSLAKLTTEISRVRRVLESFLHQYK